MNRQTISKERSNPFFAPYDTPHGTIPFNLIVIDDYKPAVIEGIKRQNDEIEAIINNPETPTFENTIVALEKSGELLNRVTTAFFNLLSAETNDEMDALAQELSPMLSEHSTNISLNERLFSRIKKVYNSKPELDAEEQMLLNKTFEGFERNGANLPEEKKARFKELSAQLSQLTLLFSQNHLQDTNSFKMNLTDKADVDGLPESALEAASLAAKEDGAEGWTITLHAPSYIPFMTYATNRELRRKLYMAYNTQCTHPDKNCNIDIVSKIVNTRLELAQILGFETFADYILKNRMASNKENVQNLLNQLKDAYKPTAIKEVEEIVSLAREMEGPNFEIMPWDFGFYSNKLREKKFGFNSEMLRPYFELSKVKEGVFGLATRLYGITFRENKDIPVYHPDVTAYDVTDSDGSFLAVLYTDFHPRKGKNSGAWMTSYKEQWIEGNTNSRPHVSVTMNFTKPTETKPALLTLGEVETFLHEFGHSLHGMFANTRFESLSGTNVWWDFVELPSQIMENFAVEADFLNTFARHYETGEPLPQELIQKILDSRNYNVAYACLRQLSFGFLDMAYYTRTTPFADNVLSFEKQAWKETQILPQIDETCMSVQFGHIMSGGYAAGYYSYKWAEVLDADAFSLFKEKGIFSKEVAQSFRDNILSRGGTEHPMALYKRFRGSEPTIDALLERNGIKK